MFPQEATRGFVRGLAHVVLLLSLLVVINSYCYQSHNHNHHHHYHSSSGQLNGHHKRQTLSEPQIVESSSWKKTVTIQEDNKPPVETKYSWSSSNSQPIDINNDKQYHVSETIRKVTTNTLTSDENTIGDGGKLISESSTGDSSNSEKSTFNVTLIHTREFGRGDPFAGVMSCPKNEYGNVVVGCKKCQCNNNIDLTDSNNCDPITGRCLKCLYNTEGDHCDVCKSGYTGDATKQQCALCVCNKLGTDQQAGPCDSQTGQCPCLPNVDGLDCGKCKQGNYKFSSGKGCEPCNCDSVGSVSSSCNEFDGHCECHPNYGGLKCNECPQGQFGEPKHRCQLCQCNPEGSLNQICDTKKGKCQCREGIGGDKCNKCARGYHGHFPDCQWCGECFKQWDEIVRLLKEQTQALLDKVKLLLEIGTTGAYAKEFREIENKLDRIKWILDNQKLDEEAIKELKAQIEELANRLRNLEKILAELEKEADSTVNRTLKVQEGLRDYDKIYDKLTLLIDSLKENATQFQEANVDGAYAIIVDSQNRSREAEKRVRDLKPMISEQEQLRRQTENMLMSTAARYNSSSLQNEASLAALAQQIYELEKNIPGINQLVCASTSTVNTCDQLCGGALCGKCGGLSCSEGATTKAHNALDLAQQAWDLLNQKFNRSRLDLDSLMEAKNRSEDALRQAKQVMGECELQKAKFDKIGQELNGIMDGVDKFSLMDGARPAEVRTLGTECLALSISLKPEQILDLARKINETISSLTNIDKILQDTAGDLNTAEQLKQQADRAKEAADNILSTVEQVLKMLQLAAIEQAKAAAAIAAAQADIEGANGDLVEITNETEYLSRWILELTEAVKRLRDRLNELRKKYAQNELYVTQAKAAADEASKLADQAEKGTDELADKVRLAEEKLVQKARQNGEMKDRAERLKTDALQLAGDISGKMNLLRELDDFFDEQVKRVKDYQDLVDDLHRQMNEYIRDIDSKAQYYRDCQT